MRMQIDLESRVYNGLPETLPAAGRTVLVWLHASVRAGYRRGKTWMLSGCPYVVEIGDKWAYLEPVLSAALRDSAAPADVRQEKEHV